MSKLKGTRSEGRNAPIELSADEFRQAGHTLIEEIATFLETLPKRPVTTAKQPKELRGIIGETSLPQEGSSTPFLLEETSQLLFDHSLFNGHPRFWGYITSTAAPIGILGELLATAVNPNVGAFILSPIATMVEKQTLRWIAELIGYPSNCGGIFVSGGNMANFVGLLAARKSKVNWDVSKVGLRNQSQLIVYCSKGTHTWIQKAADIFGFGINNIRWIDLNEHQQMETHHLSQQIILDKEKGMLPIAVIGTAGSVGTGSIDPLNDIATICEHHKLWFHIDGAYGAPAAALSELADSFKGLERADSIALDPHKWLYSPLEAGCTLVRDGNALQDTFAFHPEYYKFDGTEEDPVTNFHEFGLQNSRGFRALKVWLSLKQVGRTGYTDMIRDDIALAKQLYDLAEQHEELQAISHSLSITTFRYIPKSNSLTEKGLNKLNEELVNHIQKSGEAFLSNAVIDGKYCLRACVVNFRTTSKDIDALIGIVVRMGKTIYKKQQHDKKTPSPGTCPSG
jgi:glutamate/tyrosine decarboxylase-like PLP-dependent enzyme